VAGYAVAVDVRGGGRLLVTEALLDDVQLFAARQEKAGVGVPEGERFCKLLTSP